MFFPMLWPLIFLFLFIPVLLASFFLNLAVFSFAKLGLSPLGALALLLASIVGSLINIPISRRRIYHQPWPENIFFFFFYYPPRVNYQLICINVGGAVIPILFSLYLLLTGRAPLGPASLATLVITVVSKALARVVPGLGISLPTFIPPIMAALAALLVAPHDAAPVAYVAGALGTLLGADILNLRALSRLQAQVVSIGGAGVFDGIFLVALAAALLS
ncbi:Uncharacterized membrane protein [Thermanaeromonas toyohensis ToBE]|uniref:Uncharacterized membrane protein n=1 Tax=Thermanaeromonas toyohensis ToBE TaxID=698762 RepID=A0A1W1VHK6_9FIRM|nr:DUF1614 domain-containing protein [Thermanaeromonas toyohensis]SMB92541.1 Uncharacterized membrane protein [Thermanaeromonas toyohensis ToBE]